MNIIYQFDEIFVFLEEENQPKKRIYTLNPSCSCPQLNLGMFRGLCPGSTVVEAMIHTFTIVNISFNVIQSSTFIYRVDVENHTLYMEQWKILALLIW